MTWIFLCATIWVRSSSIRNLSPVVLEKWPKNHLFWEVFEHTHFSLHYISDHSSETTGLTELKFLVEVDFCYYGGTQKNSGHFDEVTITLMHVTGAFCICRSRFCTYSTFSIWHFELSQDFETFTNYTSTIKQRRYSLWYIRADHHKNRVVWLFRIKIQPSMPVMFIVWFSLFFYSVLTGRF